MTDSYYSRIAQNPNDLPNELQNRGHLTAKIRRSIRHSWPVVEGYSDYLRWRCRRTRAFAFVATTGRSGTTTLSDLFLGAPGCLSVHEPYPEMLSIWPPNEAKNIDQYFGDAFREIKRINILRAAVGYDLYLETNHQFIKNFSEPAIQCFGSRIRVIHLTRDPISVALSFYAIGSVPGRSVTGRPYLLDPCRPDNVLDIQDILDGDESYSHDMYRCLWYWYETEARVARMNETHPHVPLIHLTTADLNDTGKLRELTAFLGLPHLTDHVLARAGLRSNEKLDRKSRNLDITEAMTMDERLRNLLSQRFHERYLPGPPDKET